MKIVEFNPNRQMIRVGHRLYLLDLNLREDGTGTARLSEAKCDGSVSLITAAFRYDTSHSWHIMNGTGATPQAAAKDYLQKELHIRLG